MHTRRFNCRKEEKKQNKTRKQALFTKRRAKVNSLGTMQWNSFGLRTGRRRAGASTWTFLLCGPLAGRILPTVRVCVLSRSPELKQLRKHKPSVLLVYWSCPIVFSMAGRKEKRKEEKKTLSGLMSRQHPVGSSWVGTRK